MPSRGPRLHHGLVPGFGAVVGCGGAPPGLSGRGLRFVVHRGTEGFGDRLQQLLMAMRYARATGRALVTDWRDDKFQREPRAVGGWGLGGLGVGGGWEGAGLEGRARG